MLHWVIGYIVHVDEPQISVYAEEALQALIQRARAMMSTLQDSEVQKVAKAAGVLMDQWENWFKLVRRGKVDKHDV